MFTKTRFGDLLNRKLRCAFLLSFPARDSDDIASDVCRYCLSEKSFCAEVCPKAPRALGVRHTGRACTLTLVWVVDLDYAFRA